MKPEALIWDVPTRLVHWAMVALFALSWWSAENRQMDLHYQSGIAWLTLLTFRLLWGVVGSSTARFGRFVRGPKAVLAYLRTGGEKQVGHSPIGALSVIAMLFALTFQILSGLFATDIDGLDSGPLSFLISFDEARLAAKIHALSFNALLALVGLHLAAITFYLAIKRRNLIGPMLSGRSRTVPDGHEPMVPASVLRCIIACLIAGALAWAVSRGFGL